MFCNKCGNQLPDDSVFCQKCGARLNTQVNSKSVISPPEPVQTSTAPHSSYVPPRTRTQANIRLQPKTIKIIGGVIGAVILIIIISSMCSSSNSRAEFVFLQEPHLVQDVLGRAIEGEIRNVTNKTFSYVSIEFILYDSNGRQTGSAMDHIQNFGAGNTWKFSAFAFFEVARFEFHAITYIE